MALIAKSVARELDCKAVPVLRKIRHNPPQAGISGTAERRANVLGANLAGQDAANQLLRNILAAVQDIRVGDEVIGRAARRYEDRMAVMGGVL